MKRPLNGTLKGSGYSVSNLSVSKSAEFRTVQDIQKIRDDWSEFKQTLSRPTTPSTIEADARSLADTLNGSYSVNGPALMTQSDYQFSTLPPRSRLASGSSIGDWGVKKSQQSLIGVDIDRPSSNAVVNVQLEKVPNETYGLILIEGHVSKCPLMQKCNDILVEHGVCACKVW